jgi:hypothetical protein
MIEVWNRLAAGDMPFAKEREFIFTSINELMDGD